MGSGRFLSIALWAISLYCLLPGSGYGADGGEKSGLDFKRGYDINTVATVAGRVVSLPQGEQANYIFTITNNDGATYISLGPSSFWEKRGSPIRLNDEITAKGSKAQGQDGKLYLLTQKLVNQTSGAELELRNVRGEPVWSGRNTGAMRREHPTGMGRQAGGMMRSGGGMMRR